MKSVLQFRASSDFGVPRVAIVSCTVQHGVGPGAVAEDPRTAGSALPGASKRGHHDNQETGRGVRLFKENRPDCSSDSAAYDSTAEKLGCSRFTLREWCIQTERVSLKR